LFLIFREIRSPASDGAGVLMALRRYAGVLIRTRQAEGVLVCQRADVPAEFLWIQHHGGLPAPSIDGADPSPSLEAGGVVSHDEPVHVQFVDATYRFPLPRCRLWRVEARNEAVERALVDAGRLAAADVRLGGISLYRTVTDPARMIGFLALAHDAAPRDVLAPLRARDDGGWTYHPLHLCWSLGRLQPGGLLVSSRVLCPRALSGHSGVLGLRPWR